MCGCFINTINSILGCRRHLQNNTPSEIASELLSMVPLQGPSYLQTVSKPFASVTEFSCCYLHSLCFLSVSFLCLIPPLFLVLVCPLPALQDCLGMVPCTNQITLPSSFPKITRVYSFRYLYFPLL